MHDGVLFGSKLVGLFISCGKPNKVEILYNSKPQRLLVPSFHQLVDFAFNPILGGGGYFDLVFGGGGKITSPILTAVLVVQLSSNLVRMSNCQIVLNFWKKNQNL